MLLESPPDDLSKRRFDFCIIGTGPAGITLAKSLSAAGYRILMLEAGGKSLSERSQNAYKGITIGDRYHALDRARLRFLGGTSNHWAGWCRPLDAVDFRARGNVDRHAWPITKADLDPYLQAACEIVDIEPAFDDIQIDSRQLRRIEFVFSPPTRFAQKYNSLLQTSELITIVLNATVVQLITNAEAITGAVFADRQGVRHQAIANYYVLATGGIENSRLLLWSNQLSNQAVVKLPRSLGRYWMDHPEMTAGNAIIYDTDAFPLREKRPLFFAPTAEYLEHESIQNASVRLYMESPEATDQRLPGLVEAAPALSQKLREAQAAGRVRAARVMVAWEAEARCDNRIELSDEHDEHGIPRVKLFWKKSVNDWLTARKAVELIADHLIRHDLGRVRLDDWALQEGAFRESGWMAGCHHMGGTRMADDPQAGVVDRHCKVFGQENLYIAGSSVFSSGGYANPTLTIVQLALRLADHLAERARADA